MLVFLCLFLFGCSKVEVENDFHSNLEVENATGGNQSVIQIARETGVVVDFRIFRDEMRQKNQTIYAKDISPPNIMAWLKTAKNISEDSIVCFENRDCPESFRCDAKVSDAIPLRFCTLKTS